VLPELEKHCFNGILPSCVTISRSTHEVHLFGNEDIPIEKCQAESGEGWVFKSLTKVTNNMVCGIRLDSTSQNRSVQVSLELDADPITKMLSLLYIALVVTDHAGKCPWTGKLLGLRTVEGNLSLRMITISHFISRYIFRSPY
jgi:hypothetical protein